MKYSQARCLPAAKFKRLTGVSPRTFKVMVRVLKAQKRLKKKAGRPCQLSWENQLLIALQYWREYRTYYHISCDWNVSESTIYRIVIKVENILISSRKFSLPGKKTLATYEAENSLVAIDVTENPIERPKKKQKEYYSGKQKEHTLKTQIIIDQKNRKIICLGHGKGKIHDFRLFKMLKIKFGKSVAVIADKGYQGIGKIHQSSQTPIKKTQKGKLTKEQKRANRELNRLRVVIEHVNRSLKIFKILASKYRNRHRRFGLRSNLIAGIYNYELNLKTA